MIDFNMSCDDLFNFISKSLVEEDSQKSSKYDFIKKKPKLIVFLN